MWKSRLLSRLRRHRRSAPVEGDKGAYELRWQVNEWLPLLRRPGTLEKCEEYWRRYRHLDDIRELTKPDDQSRILDVGCGLSTVLHFLPGRRFGVDPLGSEYRRVYRYPDGVTVLAAGGESIPFAEGTFDVVICSNAIDHTTDPGATICEMRRVLKPGGWLILTCEVFPEGTGARDAGHPHSLSESGVRSLLADIEIVEVWRSPWIGLRAYVLGKGRTAQEELIVAGRKPDVRAPCPERAGT